MTLRNERLHYTAIYLKLNHLHSVMPKRTYEKDANKVEAAQDFEELVKDKRAIWRANSVKARQRQRRYKNRLTKEILKNFY